MRDMKLKGKDRAYLRGLGHHLKPIIQIGKEGVTENFLSNLEDCLEKHELIKIRILENAPEEKKILAEQIDRKTGGKVIQIIGKTLLFYRPFKQEPLIRLPSQL